LLSSERIVQALEHEGVTHVVGVPDNGSRALFERLWAHPHIEVILTSREGEAFGLASGLYLGGATPLVLIQNTGFFEAGDAFRGTAYNMGLPLVMLVGYRGYKTMEPGAPRVDTAATFFRAHAQRMANPLHRHARRRRYRTDSRRFFQGARDFSTHRSAHCSGDRLIC